jgi:6-phosphofructokinase 1
VAAGFRAPATHDRKGGARTGRGEQNQAGVDMPARPKKLGILTGGGDVPGLNPCMKQVVLRALAAGWEVVGIRRGWAGLAEYRIGDPEWNKKCVMPLTWNDVRTIDRTGGTFLHTSRTNPAKMREKDMPEHLKAPDQKFPLDITEHVVRNLQDMGIDALIPIGGDDTLSYAARLNKEGYPQVAIPKTMDNDVYGTDYCIGFGTAISRSVEYITQLRTPTGSHERIGVIELFGRHSGETVLIASYLTGIERALIPESSFEVHHLADFLMRDKRNNPSNYVMCAISEGATMEDGEIIERGEEDAYGHKKLGGVGLRLEKRLKELTGEEITYQALGYLMRCGAPDALDRMVAMNFANMAVDMLIDGASGLMVALQEGKYTTVGLNSVIEGKKRVDVAKFYDAVEYRPHIRRLQGQPMFLR